MPLPCGHPLEPGEAVITVTFAYSADLFTVPAVEAWARGFTALLGELP
ncbi:hypothetical protein [Streptomyces sp. NPDC003635]